MRSRLPLHRGLLYNGHNGSFRRGVGDGVGPAVTDNEQGRAGAVVVVPGGEQVNIGHELDRPRGSQGRATDGDAQFERPMLLDGEEYPEQQPEKQMEYRADDTGEDGTVQTAAVHHGVVVEQRCAADRDRQEHDQGGAMRQIYPAVTVAALPRQDYATLAFLIQERCEPAHRASHHYNTCPSILRFIVR